MADWYLVAILLGVFGYCLGPSLIGLRTMLSVNLLTNYWPWAAGGNDTLGHQLCTTDTIDGGLAPVFVVLLSMVAAVGGTFLFLRRVQVGRPAAMLDGLVFATSGFLILWTNWPQARLTALIPALFWATERLVQRMRALAQSVVPYT